MKYLILILLLILPSCVPANQLDIKPVSYIVIEPPPSLYNQCDDKHKRDYPKGSYLQSDVALLIIQLELDADKCYNTLQAIKKFIESQKAKIPQDKIISEHSDSLR